jgi:hypothetical protein
MGHERRRVMKGFAVGIVAAILLAACVQEPTVRVVHVNEAGETIPPSPSSSPEASEPEPEPVAHPKGKYGSDCSIQVRIGHESVTVRTIAREVADQINNKGNVGLVMEVTAKWLQAGSAPITQTKTVRVPVGGNKTVRFSYLADENEIDLIQAVGYGPQDGPLDCKLKV